MIELALIGFNIYTHHGYDACTNYNPGVYVERRLFLPGMYPPTCPSISEKEALDTYIKTPKWYHRVLSWFTPAHQFEDKDGYTWIAIRAGNKTLYIYRTVWRRLL